MIKIIEYFNSVREDNGSRLIEEELFLDSLERKIDQLLNQEKIYFSCLGEYEHFTIDKIKIFRNSFINRFVINIKGVQVEEIDKNKTSYIKMDALWWRLAEKLKEQRKVEQSLRRKEALKYLNS